MPESEKAVRSPILVDHESNEAVACALVLPFGFKKKSIKVRNNFNKYLDRPLGHEYLAQVSNDTLFAKWYAFLGGRAKRALFVRGPVV